MINQQQPSGKPGQAPATGALAGLICLVPIVLYSLEFHSGHQNFEFRERGGSAMQLFLVHGGRQAGWRRDGVGAELTNPGHVVRAPTLQGHAPAESWSGITLSTTADYLVGRINSAGWEGFVIVGPSGGGPLVQLVAAAMPERILWAVFVDASALEDGESINAILPAELVEFARGEATASADQSVAIPAPLFTSTFMQDARLPLQEEIAPRLVPTPDGWLDEPIRLDAKGIGRVLAAYVFLDDDRALSQGLYRAAAKRLNRPVTTRAPGSREAMITRPIELASAILAVAS
nr:alpha/beta hydrolase [Microbacterium bovistercoris]